VINTDKELGLGISQIFLSRLELSHRPDALHLPLTTPNPPYGVDVEIRAFRAVEGGAAGMQLTVRSQPTPDSLYRFLVEMIMLVQQVPGEENMPPEDFVQTVGVSTLFPFVREAVANVTMRGRFGPVWLAPINVALVNEGLRKSADEKLLKSDGQAAPRAAKAKKRVRPGS